jgi:hypothetical protein
MNIKNAEISNPGPMMGMILERNTSNPNVRNITIYTSQASLS